MQILLLPARMQERSCRRFCHCLEFPRIQYSSAENATRSTHPSVNVTSDRTEPFTLQSQATPRRKTKMRKSSSASTHPCDCNPITIRSGVKTNSSSTRRAHLRLTSLIPSQHDNQSCLDSMPSFVKRHVVLNDLLQTLLISPS